MLAEISPEALSRRLSTGEPTVIVDVREPWEIELVAMPGALAVPLGELGSRVSEIPDADDAVVVTVCHHGIRSLQAAAVLTHAGWRDVRSLAGGIDRWAREIDAAMPRYR